LVKLVHTGDSFRGANDALVSILTRDRIEVNPRRQSIQRGRGSRSGPAAGLDELGQTAVVPSVNSALIRCMLLEPTQCALDRSRPG
jgi:hypothetical protein